MAYNWNPTGDPRAQQMNVRTSIQPGGMFPAAYTRQAGNLAAALAIPGRADLMAGGHMAGVASSSPMLAWNRGTEYAGALARSLMAPAEIASQHALYNAQRRLSQQAAREREAQQWAQLGLRNQAIAQQQQNNLLNFLRNIYQPLG